MNVKKIVFILAFSVCLDVAAGVPEIVLWRGETAHFRIPDGDRFAAELPEGLSIRLGTLKEIKFMPNKRNLMYASVPDRLVWDGWTVGPKIAEITADPDMKSGVYRCGDYNVRIVGRVLPPPSEWKYILDLWQHPWAISRSHGVKPFTDEYFKVARPVYETLATAGQKFITATLLDRPWNAQCYDAYGTMIRHVKLTDGSWKFDYTDFDRYVEFALGCGIGPYIACYTLCPWGDTVSWENAKGERFSASAPAGSDAFKEYWGDFLADFSGHLKEKGWFDLTYIALDERSPEEVKVIADFIQEKAPGMKLAMAGNRDPMDFAGIKIDYYSQILYGVTDALLESVPERRAKGFFTTHYVCCGPKEPNTLLYSDEDEPFCVGYYSAAVGLDGFLRWAWNSWGKTPYADYTYFDRSNAMPGNTYLCYPDGSPSWRFLKLRQGIVAAEKARILRENGLFVKQLDSVAKRYAYGNMISGKTTYRSLADAVSAIVNRD